MTNIITINFNKPLEADRTPGEYTLGKQLIAPFNMVGNLRTYLLEVAPSKNLLKIVDDCILAALEKGEVNVTIPYKLYKLFADADDKAVKKVIGLQGISVK